MKSLDVGVRRIVFPPNQFPLPAPATHLSFEITGGLTEVAEPYGLGVDGVQIGEHPNQRVDTVADDALAAELLELVVVAHNASRHVLHHLERCPKDRVVIA